MNIFRLSDGGRINLHIFISNFTYTALVYKDQMLCGGSLMPTQGNAYVIPARSSCTLANLTSVRYSPEGIDGCFKYIINEDPCSPIFLFIKFVVVLSGSVSVAL